MVYPERGEETVRFSALDLFMSKYRDSRVVAFNDAGEELNITGVQFNFLDGKLMLHVEKS
jgi:hypothetical protein